MTNLLMLTRTQWAERICAAWHQFVRSIIEVGELLTDAKAALPHGEFEAMIANDLTFGPSTAQRLMKVARDERLSNPAHGQLLPPHWRTLYELTKLSREDFDDLLARGVINAEMERADIKKSLKGERRAEREAELAQRITALPDVKCGIIVADPEWKFEVWSEAGMDRAAANHYPTSVLDEIKARPVASIAADDCILFLWATAPMRNAAQEVMAAWGFTYKTDVIWDKGVAGTGYWNLNEHEELLIGTRGKPIAPLNGAAWGSSIIRAPRGVHSAKPEIVLEKIEQLWPHVPKIELNRRGKPRLGWFAWGNEVELPVAAE